MSIKVAILDMYDGHANQGMKCIQDILKKFRKNNSVDLTYQIFDVRAKNEIPDTSFDIYISTGGPGSPTESEGSEWENNYFAFIDELEAINNNPSRTDKKYGFFICHSFQLLCRKYKLGNVVKRRSTSFGIFPIFKTDDWDNEEIFAGTDETFYAVDSRDWQVIEPDEAQFEKTGAKLLAIEKERSHVNLERCMMAIRFSDYFFGTQFHPEADPVGMEAYLLEDENKERVIKHHGENKYYEMLHFLENPVELEFTRKEIIPSFLHNAINSMLIQEV
ncbi:type 1 glutamine amidotransferase [Rufibacter latericius]|uniref:GMP synthase n=1 Tax=Rufibacter latericius TaxID=2487040 RepID=A0A3M9MBU4_9BACT|nr:GMP synthase [Rufibacter latericius]RNI23016.1 GMP synthase [Rufibacter latericius]